MDEPHCRNRHRRAQVLSELYPETNMALAAEDILFIKQNIGEWIAEASLGKPPVVYEIELRERMVRLETSLEKQGEILQQMLHQMDKRFEQVDKRFEQIEKRFEQVDKRFEQIDKRFEELQRQMDKRFEQVDKRFEQMQSQMDKRFEQVDKRFEELTRRMDRFMFWSMGMTLTVGGIVIAVLKF